MPATVDQSCEPGSQLRVQVGNPVNVSIPQDHQSRSGEFAVDPIVKWIESQKINGGDYPMVRLTPQLLGLLSGETPMSKAQKADFARVLDKSLSPGPPVFTAHQMPNSLPMGAVSRAETSLRSLHPGVAQRLALESSENPTKFHSFRTERAQLADLTALAHKLGITNPLPPCDIKLIFDGDKVPGWYDEGIQQEARDWAVYSSHLIWLSVVFRNQADLKSLRLRRALFADPLFKDLKDVFQFLDMGTPT